MSTYAVRYTQPLLGAANAAGYLVAVPGASILVRQNGVATTVYSSRAKAAMTNPVPTGVPPGTAGVDTLGNLMLYMEPGDGYDFVATVGATSATVALPSMAADYLEPLPPAAVSEAMLAFGVATQAELDAGLATKAPSTGIAQAAVSNLVSDLAGKQATISAGTYVEPDQLVPVFLTSEYVSIQAAISAAEAAGRGTVYVVPGTHNLTVDQVTKYALRINASNISLVLDPGAIIRLANGDFNTAGDTGYLLTIGDGTTAISNVKVFGGTFDGNYLNQTEPTASISSGLITTRANVSNVEISGTRLINSIGMGLFPNGTLALPCRNINIHHNYIKSCAEGIVWLYSHGVTFADNWLETIYAQDGIEPVRSTDFKITDNTVTGCLQSGIDIYDESHDGVVSGNVLINNTEGGISVAGQGAQPGCKRITISGNKITGTGGTSSGIRVNNGNDNATEDINITGNVVTGAGGSGISVYTGTKHVDIIGNTCKGNGTNGIQVLSGAQHVRVKTNTCRDNSLTTVGSLGIYAAGDYGTYANNDCYDTRGASARQGYGIWVIAGVGNIVKDNRAYGNLTGQVIDATSVATLRNNDVSAPGVNFTGAVANYISTPDTPAVSMLGSFDLRMKWLLPDWTPGTAMCLAGKWNSTGNQRSWILLVTPDGKFEFDFSNDGTAGGIGGFVPSTVATGIADGTAKHIRLTFDSLTGFVRFYLADDMGSGVLLGAPVASGGGAYTLFNNTEPLTFGSYGGGSLNNAAGKIYRAQLRNNILDNGTGIVFDVDLAKGFGLSGTRQPNLMTEDSSNAAVVTLNGSAWTWAA